MGGLQRLPFPGTAETSQTYQQDGNWRKDPSVGAGHNEGEQQSGGLECEKQANTRGNDRADQGERTTGERHGSTAESRASITPRRRRVDAQRGGCYKVHFEAAV